MSSSTSGHRPVQDPLELLGVDALLGPDELAVRDTVRRYVDDKIRPHVADWFDSGSIPVRELAKELGSLGVLGMHLQGYGCAGMSGTAYGLAAMELEAADSGLRSMVSVQGSLAMFAIHRWGSDDQKAEWLPRLATGEAIGCFGLTEADFGSDPAGMRTRARHDGPDWILTGSKMWITNGSVADVAIVWAQTDDKIRGFVVPTNAPGFSSSAMKRKLSLRASVTSELVLDAVRLPGSALLPEASGLSGPLSCLNEARFGIVFGSLGAARDCLQATLAYGEHRRIFGKALSAFQISQTKLADMALQLGTGMLLALHLGRLKDTGQLTATQVSMGKLNNVRAALHIARECRAMLGAAGITLDYPILRHANNLESVLTYEGTTEIHQLVVAQALTGHAAFR